MKIAKKLLPIFGFMLLIITIFVFGQTYAKYLTSASGNANMSIAKWNIKVNNLSVKNNSDISSTIAPSFPGTENIASGIIAPNAEGYFDLNFDFSNVDVSFEYQVITTPNNQSIVKDLIATGYSVDNGEIISLDSSGNITKEINLQTKPSTQKVRIFIKWIEDESQKMDNTADTSAANSANPVATLDVTVKFKQI